MEDEEKRRKRLGVGADLFMGRAWINLGSLPLITLHRIRTVRAKPQSTMSHPAKSEVHPGSAD